jgi:hypothetical protein
MIGRMFALLFLVPFILSSILIVFSPRTYIKLRASPMKPGARITWGKRFVFAAMLPVACVLLYELIISFRGAGP